ncbi:S8 family serine peptidase [Kribbella sp. NPDC049227]|uniref:S8 family serine peptidase n=1 Tax=Kribbella sp. NPDC049227 TaxID=3364113 RepID=UPI00371882ED
MAGTGAASGGRYRGVAPAASLAIGKVLDDSGNGTAESVIAGMLWAATEVKAKVVNLSLGSEPADGTDPLSEAVDTLSREHGTLFVAAAGNAGEDENVASPAAADEALAVGSVNRDEVPSGFSNRGPRLGDSMVKPELVAPGEGIAAARPTDVPPLGEPVDAAYQRLDGTSMATPHVTGSAALVAQQHPSWTGRSSSLP